MSDVCATKMRVVVGYPPSPVHRLYNLGCDTSLSLLPPIGLLPPNPSEAKLLGEGLLIQERKESQPYLPRGL